MKNLTLIQAILSFSFSTDSGTPTEHLQLVSSKNIHWFRFYDFFSIKFCVDFFLTVSYLTNYPTNNRCFISLFIECGVSYNYIALALAPRGA